MAVSVLCLFLAVQWVGLLSVIVALPGHTHMPFGTLIGFLVFSDTKHCIVGIMNVACLICCSFQLTVYLCIDLFIYIYLIKTADQYQHCFSSMDSIIVMKLHWNDW